MNTTTGKLLVLFAATAAMSRLFLLAAAQEPAFTAITDTPISEEYAFSAAWGDYDRDGFIDLLAVDFGDEGVGRVYLFGNQGDGSFDKTTLEPSAYSHSGYIIGAIWGDYDNDGQADILISGGGLWIGPNPNILLRQEPDGSFARSLSPQFPSGYSQSSLWGDFDQDGWLDVFAGYWAGKSIAAATDILYRNRGDGTFVNTEAAGIHQMNDNSNSAMAACTGDFNADGRIDIIVTTVSPNRSRLYLNNGDLSFDRILVTPGAPDGWAGYGNGIAVADYDNDGDLDFLTVSKSGSGSWTCACDGNFAGLTRLWRNDGQGSFEQVVAGDLGNGDTIGVNAGAWADYNNDGWLDVALFRGIYSNGRGQKPGDVLYRNNGDGTFTRVTEGSIVDEIGDARAGAWGDIDNDGDMDLVVANYTWGAAAGSNVLPVLYRNEGNDNYWLKLSLIGTEGNRDAIGAKVRVRANINGKEVWQLRELRTNTGWIASQNDMRPHFGLGDATVAAVVLIEWPSGTMQELTDVAAGQILEVVEPPRLRVDSPDRLSWSATAEGFQLESAASVNGPWSEATETVEASESRMSVPVETDTGAKFYRLREL